MNRTTIARAVAGSAVLTGLAVSALMISGSSAATSGRSSAVIDRNDFVRHITNPYLPWRPGSVWVYRGVKDGQTQRDVVKVLKRTKTILGVKATVVSDVATHNGTVLERTEDWYAQDRAGNVWYLGESTAAYEGGTVDTSGSWQAGVDGAVPGIVMTADPQVGDTHRQEYWRGQAEDQYWLVDLRQHVSVPFGTFSRAALTLEWTRLEPGGIDRKYYVRGIGVVKEVAAQGPPEVAKLVRFTHP
ncbi:MAG: hypothetical protein QOE17_1193 [Gaiellales bacterium]|nr:hypothetical protein [Gaiellales bacterium]